MHTFTRLALLTATVSCGVGATAVLGAGCAETSSEAVLEDDSGSPASVGRDADARVKDTGTTEIVPPAEDGGSWPSCDTKPTALTPRPIVDLWNANPENPTDVWLSGVVVTAVSGSVCRANSACQIFLQDDETYSSLSAGSLHAIKLFISAATAERFTGVSVGDRLDVRAWAWRYTLSGQNEMMVQINSQLHGCTKKVGTATPEPTPAALSALSLDAYENTVGPLLIRVSNVSGKPGTPTQTFGLYTTGSPPSDAGTKQVVSASPYFIKGGAFDGLSQGATTNFASISGIFGLFVPSAGTTKYLEIYTRSMNDVVTK